MSTKMNWLLVGAGFLAGTVGVKVLTSKPAKKVYVQGVAAGMRAKNNYQEIVEEAKAHMDDIVAEAEYINVTKQPEVEVDEIDVEAEKAAAKKPLKKAPAAKPAK